MRENKKEVHIKTRLIKILIMLIHLKNQSKLSEINNNQLLFQKVDLEETAV